MTKYQRIAGVFKTPEGTFHPTLYFLDENENVVSKERIGEPVGSEYEAMETASLHLEKLLDMEHYEEVISKILEDGGPYMHNKLSLTLRDVYFTLGVGFSNHLVKKFNLQDYGIEGLTKS